MGQTYIIGRIPKWPTGADCKSAGLYLRGFKSLSSHFFAEVAQLVEHQPSKLRVASSNLVFRSKSCRCSSGVERILGKDEVMSSNLITGSTLVLINNIYT